MDHPGELAYPRRLASVLVTTLLGVALAAGAPALAQTQGACDQYLPNCDRGDGPRGQTGNEQPGGPSQSSGAGPGSVVSPTQAGGAANGTGAPANNPAGDGSGSAATDPGGTGGSASLSSAANAGEGDAGGGDLLGTDYPVTGWILVAAAVLAALAALLLVRYGWAVLRRRGGAAAG
jgi:hypothetical protein